MTLKFIRKIILFGVLAAALFTAGLYVGFRIQTNDKGEVVKVTLGRELPPDKIINFALFWEIWDTLEQSYYDPEKINEGDMVYGAIKGMVAALGDPYTTFLIPRENEIVQEDLQGNFEGVGIQIGFIGTQLAVVAPLPGSPAEQAGVEAGDYIIGIKDDQKGLDRGTVGITLPEAVQSIRGPAGSSVTLALLREGSETPMILEVERKSISVPSLTFEYIGEQESIAHVRLLKFGGDTVAQWDNMVAEIIAKKDLAGIIIDVRNNTGGYLQAAVDIAGDFVDTEQVVVIEQTGDQKREFISERFPRLQNYKSVMLVNKGSASASEILAGALRDQKSIKLIGTETFGKGTIQEPRQIEGGAGLHITIAKWLTPTEFWVNEVGLTPDTLIEDNPETPEDEQLQSAVQYISSL